MSTRNRGILLLLAALALFGGTTSQLLPAECFLAGLVCALVGCVSFMKGNREKLLKAEARTARAINPVIRNQAMERYAERQARTSVPADTAATDLARGSAGHPAEALPATPVSDELVLYEVDDASGNDASSDGDFRVTTDVSFPVEVQETASLAEQLEKLQRLREDGMLTLEEFDVAKAKLLS